MFYAYVYVLEGPNDGKLLKFVTKDRAYVPYSEQSILSNDYILI